MASWTAGSGWVVRETGLIGGGVGGGATLLGWGEGIDTAEQGREGEGVLWKLSLYLDGILAEVDSSSWKYIYLKQKLLILTQIWICYR